MNLSPEMCARMDIASMVEDHFAVNEEIRFSEDIPKVISEIVKTYPEAGGQFYFQFLPQEIAWYCGINLV